MAPINIADIEINSTTTGDQVNANTQRFADGRFIVFYESNDNALNGTDIRARMFNPDGSPIGNDFLVNQAVTGGNQVGGLGAVINTNGAGDNDDTVTIFWRTPDTGNPSLFNLVGRKFGIDGTPAAAEFQVNTTAGVANYNFAITNNGAVYFTWQRGGDIFARSFNSSLSPLMAETQINTTTTGTQDRPRIGILSSGAVEIMWLSNDGLGADTSGFGIRSRVITTSSGVLNVGTAANDFVVNTTTAGDQQNPQISRLFDNRMLEVWNSNETGDGSGTSIRGRILDSNGQVVAGQDDFLINLTTIGNQLAPGVLAFNDGTRLIFWHSYETGGPNGPDTIRGRIMHADGTLDASEIVFTGDEPLPDPGPSTPAMSFRVLPNQQILVTYTGIESTDISGRAVSASIIELEPTLPHKDWDQAALQIGPDAGWNDVLGSEHTITYAYAATLHGFVYGGNGASGFSQFSLAQIAAAEAALDLWADVANVTFVRQQDVGSEYSDSAQFLLWNYASATAGSQAASASGFGFAGGSGATERHHVYLNDDRTKVTAPDFANDGFRLYMHEIGHALGLDHPGNYNVLPGGAGTPYDGNAQFVEDTWQYTVMSYFDETITHANFGDVEAMTPMLYDIAAAQRLYGVNTTTRTGNTTYGFNSNADRAVFQITADDTNVAFTVWDAGGTDTLDFSGFSRPQIIDLREQHFSSVGGLQENVAIARGAQIENAVGGSNADFIVGNQLANTLAGRTGGDELVGDGPVLETANAGSVERLYLATLGRAPDDAGHEDWTGQLDQGASLQEIAAGFVNSPEFQLRYGSLNNADFVTLLYNNVLHRDPDSGGLAHWVGQLDGGTPRAVVVTGFSDSFEFILKTDHATHAAQIYRLYGATLDREPDAGGFEGWVDLLNSGTALVDAAAGFVGSPEFQLTYGSLDNTQFVTLLYNNVLNRAPDQGGLDHWLAELAGGATRADVVVGFSDSVEYQNSTASTLDTFMRTALPSWMDTVWGGAGDDQMSAGRGSDTFIFLQGDGGDHVYELETWDTLRLVGFGYADAAAALAHVTVEGDNVVFSDQGQTIRFHDTSLATLQQTGWLLS